MSWAFQGVANACIQILLIIAFGYVLTWQHFFGDKFLPQINTFLLLASFPALNLNMIGINLDLQNAAGWKGIAAYILWIAIIQVCILAYVWLFAKRDVGEAALLNLLLVANNTIIIGLPIMDATFGTAGRYISLLTAVPLFVQVMPFSIVLFEMERWVIQQAAGVTSSENLASHASLPINGNGPHHLGSTDSLVALTAHQQLQPASSSASEDEGPHDSLPGVPSVGGMLPSSDSTTTLTIPPSVAAGDEADAPGIAAAAGAPTGAAAGAAPGMSTDAAASGNRADEPHQSLQPQHASEGGGHGALHTASQPAARGLMTSPSEPQLAMSGATTAAGSVEMAAQVVARVQPLHRLAHAAGPVVELPGQVHSITGVEVGSGQHASAGHNQQGASGPVLSMDSPHRKSNGQQQHEGDMQRAAGRSLSKSHSFSQQWHAALQHFSEMRRRRKRLKQKQREMVSVVDVPLPVPPEVQLGQLRLVDPSDSHHHHDDHHHFDHHQHLDNVPGSPIGDQQHSSWRDHPWDALYRILSRSRASFGHLTSSFRRKHGGATHSTAGNALDTPLDSDGVAGLPRFHNPMFASSAGQHALQDNSKSHDVLGRSPAGGGGALQAGLGGRVQTSQRSMLRAQVMERAMHQAVRKHGGFFRVVGGYLKTRIARLWFVVWIIIKNPMMWSLMVAVVISASGLRRYLDPKSPQYVIEMGWLVQSFSMLSGTTVPLALFSNGVFLYGKRFWEGNLRKAAIVIVLKLTVLPALQLLCAKILSLDTASAMSLVLLSVCPCATTAFVVASQYNHGTEVITLCTIVLTVLLVPLMLGALNLPKAMDLYDFDSSVFPLP